MWGADNLFLTLKDKLPSSWRRPVDRAAASGAARPGGAKAGLAPPHAMAPPEPLDLRHAIPSAPLGEVARGALWRAIPIGNATWIVGPGQGFMLCESGLNGLHAALGEVIARRRR